MRNRLFAAVALFALIFLFGNATAIMKTLSTQYEFCIDFNYSGVSYLEGVSNCIHYATTPKSLEICDRIPAEIEDYDQALLLCYAKYAKANNDTSACLKLQLGQEEIGNCYAYGFFCDKINDAENKAECEQKKINAQIAGFGSAVATIIMALVYFGIPLAILYLIIRPLIDHIRKKNPKGKAIVRNVLLIIVLAIIWFVVVMTFCLPPFCYVLT